MRKAVAIELTPEEASTLQTIVQSGRSEVRDAQRAKIVLMAAEGLQNREIAEQLSVSEPKVARWRDRFARDRLQGLTERAGRGRKRTYGAEQVGQIIEKTLTTTPQNATHWTTRTMAEQVGVSHTTVRRIWNAHQIRPHVLKTFRRVRGPEPLHPHLQARLSNDPNFAEKLRDIIGLYLNPPEHAVVLCVDEKSSIQALDRSQPGLPLKKGRAGTMTHDYKRHGVTTLFAALNVLDGTVISSCKKRHRHIEYLEFLRQIKRTVPKDMDVHLVVDNYSTHKHHSVKQWHARNPRFHVHFTPTSASWLNLVERFFAEITQKRIRRGVFHSVLELTDAIDAFIEAHNQNPKAFKWMKTAEDILQDLAPLYKQNK